MRLLVFCWMSMLSLGGYLADAQGEHAPSLPKEKGARATAPLPEFEVMCRGTVVRGAQRTRYWRSNEDGTRRIELRKMADGTFQIETYFPTADGKRSNQKVYFFNATKNKPPAPLELEERVSLPIFQPMTASFQYTPDGKLKSGEMVQLGRTGRNGPPGRKLDYAIDCD